MTSTQIADNSQPRLRRPPARTGGAVFWLPLAAIVAAAIAGIALVTYLMWPRWPGGAVSLDAPALPITVAGVAFNVPPAAIRVAVQRRPGAQDRVDLAFRWPSLEPPDPNAKSSAAAPETTSAPVPTLERIFVTISSAGDTLAPADRVATIYPRYFVSDAVEGPGGLALLAFREGTPYQGEDLIYDAVAQVFLVRCTRNGVGPTPGTCLYERRIETADVVVRFPRDWLNDWRAVAAKIDRLITSLRPPVG